MTEISLAAEKILSIGQITISNSMLTTWIAMIMIAVIALISYKQRSLVPRGINKYLEPLIEFLMNTFDGVTGDRKKTKEFLPLLGTFFIFILANNWLGLVPGVGTITIFNGDHNVPLFRGGNADLNSTFALAIVSVVAAQYYGIKHLGTMKYLKKYFNSDNIIMGVVGILELISEFSKIISFSFRLFGNIFAGEVLLIVIAFLVPLVAPLPFFGLEIFVGLIQAIVFTMLTLVFLTIATSLQEH